jgi:hypothetical protein
LRFSVPFFFFAYFFESHVETTGGRASLFRNGRAAPPGFTIFGISIPAIDMPGSTQQRDQEFSMQYALIIREAAEDFARRGDPAYRDGWVAYSKALAQAGIMTGGAGLTGPETGTIVRRKGEEHDVQDGPYPEGKEQLGGFYLIDVPDIDTALEWATRVPISDKGSVEVRPRLQM